MPLFYPPLTQPMIIGTEATSMAGGVAVLLTINVPFLYAFEVSGQGLLIHSARWRIGATATGHTNMAIYTAAGNLVAGSDTGSIVNTANTTFTQNYGADVWLPPGQYFLAIASDNGSDTYEGVSGVSARAALSRHRIGTNLLAAGAMPSTLGAISNNPGNSAGMALIPTGSLIV